MSRGSTFAARCCRALARSRGRTSSTPVERFRFGAPRADGTPGYGTLQKISYSGLIFVVVPLLILTGLAQMPAFTAIAPWLIDAFGGRQTARTLHVIGTLVLLLFVVVHVVEVALAGLVSGVRAMITGRVRQPAQEDH